MKLRLRSLDLIHVIHINFLKQITMNKTLKFNLSKLANETILNNYSKCIMIDIDDAIETVAGWFIIYKRKLQKEFCFGYNDSEESYNIAVEMDKLASTDPSYFISQNLKWYDNLIEQLESGDGYFTSLSYDYPSAPFIDVINARTAYNISEKHLPIRYGLLPKEDIEKLIIFVKQLRAKQEKRCHNYIKKYGMANIKSWIYDSNN